MGSFEVQRGRNNHMNSSPMGEASPVWEIPVALASGWGIVFQGRLPTGGEVESN